MRSLLFLAMLALPIGLFLWARRRRAPSMSLEAARAGFEAVMAGAPLTDDLIKAVAMHTVHNSYDVEGVVVQGINSDLYLVRTTNGTVFRSVRSKPLWQRSVVLQPGERVALFAVRGSDRAQIMRRL